MIGLSATPAKNLICGRFNKDQIHTYTLVEENKLKKEFPEIYPYADINFLLWSLTPEEKTHLSIYSDEEQFTMKKLFRIEDDEFYYKADIVYLFKKLIGSKDICRECKLGTMYPFKNYAKYSSIKTILLFVPSINVQEKLVGLLNEIKEYKEDFDIHITNSNLYPSNKLIKAIKREFKSNNKRSIIIAVDQLTTGITLEDCDMVVFMNDWESIDKWIQASFRSQSPRIGKKQCYVLDLNPTRTFEMIYDYNNIINKFGNKPMEQSINEWFECVNVFNRVDGDFVKVDVNKFNEEYIKILIEKPRFNYQSVIFSDKLQIVKDKLLNLGISNTTSSVKEKLNENAPEKGKDKIKTNSNKGNLKNDVDISKLMNIAKALLDKTMLLSIFTYFKHDKVDECLNMLENDNSVVEGIGELEKNMFLEALLLGIENADNIKLSDIKFIYNTIYDKEIINKKIHIFNQKIKKIIELINNGDLNMLKNYIELINDYLVPSNTEKKQLGEVFTPFGLINEMLDTLPKDVWSNPNLKWLDPANGIGNFPAVIVQRLMEGLKEWEPNEERRLKHILENMIYVCELQPKNVFIYMMIFNPDNKYKLNICRGDFLSKDFDEKMNDWGVNNFDVVVGNPPYQDKSDKKKGTTGKKNLYQKFILKSLNILNKNSYFLFITPPGFLKTTIFNKKTQIFEKISSLNLIYLNLTDINAKYFNVGTPICYYLLKTNNEYLNTKIITDSDELLINIREFNFIPRLLFRQTYSIIKKVSSKGVNFNFKRNSKNINGNYVTLKRLNHINKNGYMKVHEGKNGLIYDLTHECENPKEFAELLDKKLYRFLNYTLRHDGVIYHYFINGFCYPINYTNIKTDADLYKYFNLTDEEIKLIESVIK